MRHLLAAAASLLAANAAWADAPNADPDARVLVLEAARLAIFLEDVSDLSESRFSSSGDIEAALMAMESHRPDQLGRGWLSYGALLAAQSPEFVDGVREVADYYGRSDVALALTNDPSYAATFPGATGARAAVSARISDNSTRLRGVASHLQQQSYTLQRESWANARIGDSGGRIARWDAELAPRGAAPTILSSIGAPGVIDSRSVLERSSALDAFHTVFQIGPSLAATPTEAAGLTMGLGSAAPDFVDRAMTLAALEALDAAPATTEESSSSMLLREPNTQNCLEMARLNFHQCLAAAYRVYEDPFCIAQHALSEVAGCFTTSG